MRQPHKPTVAELEILDVLWEFKKATVREVFDVLCKRKNTTYTTVLKTMQIMQEKGLVQRDVKEKAHVYRPKQTQRQTQTNLVGDLLEKAFRGSALGLVQHVLETKPTTPDELAEIRRMINEVEARGESR